MFNEIDDLAETVPLVQHRLKNFKRINKSVWNFSCPLCGDSKKSRAKTRGYIYFNPKAKTLWYKCHNCQSHKSYVNFLKEVDKSLHDDIMLKTYVKKNTKGQKPLDFSVDLTNLVEVEKFVEQSLLSKVMEPVSYLPLTHPAREYIDARSLPEGSLDDIYFVEDIKKIEQLSSKYKDKMSENESRIGLPYRNRKGQIIGISLRSLQKEHPIKYLHLKFNERYPLIYNLENLDMGKRVYVLEGQFDSMFFENGCAASGSAFTRVHEVVPITQCTFIHDNEPRHKEVCRSIEKSIKAGYSVCLLPHYITSKDINEMVLSGEVSREGLKDLVDKHTYRGLEAKLQFTKWKLL